MYIVEDGSLHDSEDSTVNKLNSAAANLTQPQREARARFRSWIFACFLLLTYITLAVTTAQVKFWQNRDLYSI